MVDNRRFRLGTATGGRLCHTNLVNSRVDVSIRRKDFAKTLYHSHDHKLASICVQTTMATRANG